MCSPKSDPRSGGCRCGCQPSAPSSCKPDVRTEDPESSLSGSTRAPTAAAGFLKRISKWITLSPPAPSGPPTTSGHSHDGCCSVDLRASKSPASRATKLRPTPSDGLGRRANLPDARMGRRWRSGHSEDILLRSTVTWVSGAPPCPQCHHPNTRVGLLDSRPAAVACMNCTYAALLHPMPPAYESPEIHCCSR